MADLRDTMDEDDVDNEPAKMIKKLLRSWVSEKSAPELLTYEEEAVTCLQQEIQEQEESSREHAKESTTNQFLFNVYQMEIGRLRYALNAYLRTRLWKIEQHVLHILKSDILRGRLSSAEIRYAEQYRDLLEGHMMTSCLQELPEKFRKIDSVTSSENMVPTPNTDAYIFCRVHETIGQIGISDQSTLTLEEGDLYILRYASVEQFLQAGRLSLI